MRNASRSGTRACARERRDFSHDTPGYDRFGARLDEMRGLRPGRRAAGWSTIA
jgi:hypothetical protein